MTWLGATNRSYTGSSAVLVFNFTDFSSSPATIHPTGNAGFSGSAVQLINTPPGHFAGGAWYTIAQPPTAFTTVFKWQPESYGPGITASGITFCIQNNEGTSYSGDANTCGYSAALGQKPDGNSVPSMAIKFDAGQMSIGETYPAGGLPASTGLYLNGGGCLVNPGSGIGLVPFDDLNPEGFSFYNMGRIFQVTIVYDGSLITMVLLDTTSGAQARRVWPLNLANTMNNAGASNYVGFTAGTAAAGYFNLLSWAYYSGYNTRLSTPTFSPSPGQYASTQSVAINFPSGSACYYTTNGILPTSASTLYTGPITVSTNTVIQAVAIQSGFTDSLVASGVYKINTANTINFPSGFAAGNLVPVAYAYLSGSAYRVSDAAQSAVQGTCGAVWFPAPVTISTFSTTFTLQWGSSGMGMCFVIQNSTPAYASPSSAIGWSGGATTCGATVEAFGYAGQDAANGKPSGSGVGYGYGLLSSIAIAFDQNVTPNSIGLYTNGNFYTSGAILGSQAATGLTFSSGHAFTVTLSYDGTTLTFSMTDTVTTTNFTTTFTINIPSIVGGNTAYVGFTGGTYSAASIAAITNWTGF
jgi:hypothetical protein